MPLTQPLPLAGERSMKEDERGPEDSEVLRVALEDLELVAALVLALEGDLVAGAADGLAVLVLVGILEADPLALERPLALGDLAVFQQAERAVLAVVLEDHLAIDLAGHRVADQRQPGFGAGHRLGGRRRGSRGSLASRGAGAAGRAGPRAGILDLQAEDVGQRV